MLKKINNIFKWLKSPDENAILGIFDFTYQHYALGDLLTQLIKLKIFSLEQLKTILIMSIIFFQFFYVFRIFVPCVLFVMKIL